MKTRTCTDNDDRTCWRRHPGRRLGCRYRRHNSRRGSGEGKKKPAFQWPPAIRVKSPDPADLGQWFDAMPAYAGSSEDNRRPHRTIRNQPGTSAAIDRDYPSISYIPLLIPTFHEISSEMHESLDLVRDCIQKVAIAKREDERPAGLLPYHPRWRQTWTTTGPMPEGLERR